MPDGVEEDVDIAIVELKLGVPEEGLKLADALDGRPDAVRLTVPPKTPERVTLTVVFVELPCVTDPEVGFMVTVKSEEMFSDAVPVSPSSSATVSVTVKVPLLV